MDVRLCQTAVFFYCFLLFLLSETKSQSEIEIERVFKSGSMLLLIRMTGPSSNICCAQNRKTGLFFRLFFNLLSRSLSLSLSFLEEVPMLDGSPSLSLYLSLFQVVVDIKVVSFFPSISPSIFYLGCCLKVLLCCAVCDCCCRLAWPTPRRADCLPRETWPTSSCQREVMPIAYPSRLHAMLQSQ